jgi:hypothetical protein
LSFGSEGRLAVTIDFETYLHHIQTIATWFDMFARGGGEAMIAEAKAFIVQSSYQELARESHKPINRMLEEAVIFSLCREYPHSTCRELLELGFLIENLYDIIEKKREDEYVKCVWHQYDIDEEILRQVDQPY